MIVVSESHRMRQKVQAIWTQHRARLIALSLTLLGGLLRVYDIGANSFNNDEVFALWLADGAAKGNREKGKEVFEEFRKRWKRPIQYVHKNLTSPS